MNRKYGGLKRFKKRDATPLKVLKAVKVKRKKKSIYEMIPVNVGV